MIPRFSTRSSTSIVRSPIRKVELGLEDLVEVSRARRLASRSGSAAARHVTRSPAPSSPSSRPSSVSTTPRSSHTTKPSSSLSASTSDRSNSMCGDTGVSTRQRSAGDAIGPRTENEYAVVPVGVATITPSAAYVVNGAAVDRHVEADEVAAALLLSAASLSANHVPAAGPCDVTSHREHHALRHGEVAGEQPRHRRIELVGLDLGEVAELADVHAEDRHRRRVHEVDRVQHRAVAAERDDEIETVGEALRPRPRARAGSTALASSAGTRTSTPRSRNQPAAERASSCASPRSRCGTRPTARVGTSLMRLRPPALYLRRTVSPEVRASGSAPGRSRRHHVGGGNDTVDLGVVDFRGADPTRGEELDVAVGAAQRRR